MGYFNTAVLRVIIFHSKGYWPVKWLCRMLVDLIIVNVILISAVVSVHTSSIQIDLWCNYSPPPPSPPSAPLPPLRSRCIRCNAFETYRDRLIEFQNGNNFFCSLFSFPDGWWSRHFFFDFFFIFRKLYFSLYALWTKWLKSEIGAVWLSCCHCVEKCKQ